MDPYGRRREAMLRFGFDSGRTGEFSFHLCLEDYFSFLETDALVPDILDSEGMIEDGDGRVA